MKGLTKTENLKYQLEALASYEPADIDNPEFEVGYEDEGGNEGFATVCCVDVATRALERIKELELDLGLVNISLEQKTTLLNSCDLALQRAQLSSK
jgi:hypothetical protein